MSDSPSDSSDREQSLIDDAKYICDELVRGDAVQGEVLKNAQPLIASLLKAVYSYESKSPRVPEDIIPVETAMSALMISISPVSVQSLKDTQCTGARRGANRALAATLGLDPSELSNADRFSRGLLIFTVVVLFAAIGTTVASEITSPNTNGAPQAQTAKRPPPPQANRNSSSGVPPAKSQTKSGGAR